MTLYFSIIHVNQVEREFNLHYAMYYQVLDILFALYNVISSTIVMYY